MNPADGVLRWRRIPLGSLNHRLCAVTLGDIWPGSDASLHDSCLHCASVLAVCNARCKTSYLIDIFHLILTNLYYQVITILSSAIYIFMDPTGFEPATSSMPWRRSTAELRAQINFYPISTCMRFQIFFSPICIIFALKFF